MYLLIKILYFINDQTFVLVWHCNDFSRQNLKDNIHG